MLYLSGWDNQFFGDYHFLRTHTWNTFIYQNIIQTRNISTALDYLWINDYLHIFILGNWFRKLLLRASTSLYLHSVKILSSSRGHFGSEIWDAHRYVESGLHPSRASDGLSLASRRGWSRSIVMYYRVVGNATSKAFGPE